MLAVACICVNQAEVERLVAAGIDVNVMQSGRTPLLLAAEAGRAEIVDALVAAGAKLNVFNRDGMTPLQVACLEGFHAVVEKLIAAGANVNAPSREGDTPLLIAARKEHTKVMATLLAA